MDDVKDSIEESFDSLEVELNGKFGRTIYIFKINTSFTSYQYESQIFATNFCLLTLLVNIGMIKVLE